MKIRQIVDVVRTAIRAIRRGERVVVLGDALRTINNLQQRLDREQGVLQSEIKRLSKQNVDLVRAFRHKMSRKARCEYRSQLQQELIQLQFEYSRVIAENLRLRNSDVI